MRPIKHRLHVSEQAVLDNLGYQAMAGGTLRHKMEIDIQALNVDFDITDNLTLSSYTQVRDMERNGGQDQDGSPYDALHAWAGRFSADEQGGIQFESFTQELKVSLSSSMGRLTLCWAPVTLTTITSSRSDIWGYCSATVC